MLQNFTDLLPYRIVNESDILQMYSLNGTGMGGRFVVPETGNQDPALGGGNYSQTSVGAAYAGTVSLRYENPRKVKFSASGDNKFTVIGLMTHGTADFDNNGQKIIYQPYLKDELQVVVSGETTQIAVRGQFRLKSTAYSGQPLIGSVGVVHNIELGKIQFLPYASVADKNTILCKCLSFSGSAFGGYADVLLTLT